MSTFLYFAFGSNMLAKHIRLKHPSAKRIGVGELKNCRLDFHTDSDKWAGARATVVYQAGEVIYGAIWQIDTKDIKDLDDQKGVNAGIYMPIRLTVLNVTDNQFVPCRVYYLRNQPKVPLKALPIDEIPEDRKPSYTYIRTLLKGAIETGLPEHYVQWLASIQHNNNLALEMEILLYLDLD